MAIHLRQVCLVAEKPAPLLQHIETVFQTPICHRDPEVSTFGLENALFALGSQFLEVVFPIRNGTAASRFLERRGGDGGYMVICQAPTLEEQAAIRGRAEASGVRVAFESDRGSWNILQFHPADMGAAFLEVDWDAQAAMEGNWQPAGGLAWTRETSAASAGYAIKGLELSGNDPQQLATRWSCVTGVPLSTSHGLPTLKLGNAMLRFSQGETPSDNGLTAIDVQVPDTAAVLARAASLNLSTGPAGFRLGGVRFHCA